MGIGGTMIGGFGVCSGVPSDFDAGLFCLAVAALRKLSSRLRTALAKQCSLVCPSSGSDSIAKKPCVGRGRKLAGLAAGIGFALVVLAGMMALYFGWLRSAGVFDAGGQAMRLRLDAMGVHSPAVYAGVGLFYSLVHSLLEEYYWRWFVFRGLRRHLNLWPAIAISSVAFMGHHVDRVRNLFRLG